MAGLGPRCNSGERAGLVTNTALGFARKQEKVVNCQSWYLQKSVATQTDSQCKLVTWPQLSGQGNTPAMEYEMELS